MKRLLLLLAMLALAAGGVLAGVPAAYAPLVVMPRAVDDHQEYDLRPALERARRENRRLYVYLGAQDCAFCKRYERFLEQHAAELVPEFAKDWIVVDLRSRLATRADTLWLQTGPRPLAYAEFQRALGDERARQLVYPSVWLLDGQARVLMPMPAGTGTFETVPEQLEILRLEQ
ncbi:MAG: thioredoxin family protein [Rubrivivax sp.]